MKRRPAALAEAVAVAWAPIFGAGQNAALALTAVLLVVGMLAAGAKPIPDITSTGR